MIQGILALYARPQGGQMPVVKRLGSRMRGKKTKEKKSMIGPLALEELGSHRHPRPLFDKRASAQSQAS